MSKQLVEPKEEEIDSSFSDIHNYDSSYSFAPSQTLPASDGTTVKDEPMDDFDYAYANVLRIGPGDVGLPADGCDAVKYEEMDEQPDNLDQEEERNPEITQAIVMVLDNQRLEGQKRAVMREALKDSLLRNVQLSDIVRVYGFDTDEKTICKLLNMARVFLSGICRRSGKSVPEVFAQSFSFTRGFVPGPPIDPNDFARIQKITDTITELTSRCMYQSRGKEQARAALIDICMGEMTLNAAANKYNIPSSTIHPYLRKARETLGSILPPPANTPSTWTSIMRTFDDSAPSTSRSAAQHQLGYTGKAANADVATLEEVEKQTRMVIQNLKSMGNENRRGSLFRAVVASVMGTMTIREASFEERLSPSTVHPYVAKVRHALGHRCPQPKSVVIANSRALPQSLRLPRKGVKAEHYDPNEDDSCSDDDVNGEEDEERDVKPAKLRWNEPGNDDPITAQLRMSYHGDHWITDTNGDDNAELLSNIFLQRTSDAGRMERLKSTIQYVVNDRNASRKERSIIRSLLIHHLCNGFDIDTLLSMYGEFAQFTSEQLEEYCEVIREIYMKSSIIINEFAVNLVRCSRISETGKKEERERLVAEMRRSFPLLATPKWLQEMRDQENADTKIRFYIYHALLAIVKLRTLGLVLTPILINAIVRMTVFNISPPVNSSRDTCVRTTKYIKNVIMKNRLSIENLSS